MDNKVLGGLILVCVLVVVVAGVIIYNSQPSTFGVNNTAINTGNMNNTNNNILPSNRPLSLLTGLLILKLSSGQSSSSNFLPSPSPKPIPNPTPKPTPTPMDNIIHLFDAYVKSTYPQTGIPGLAMVIVQNDKIIYMNCLGVRDVSTGALVNTHTLFQLASDTKAITSTNIAQMVDMGILSWNDTITQPYLNYLKIIIPSKI
ncbi:serine hydrolase [Methanobacterium spitsbergense]|uniref:Beta-lactamase family protein n=1 Tax=Methanobacterium spitsbergense TaxID=2874285 RepID=A0A8T5UY28_9EURY|nr:serine hydrolase domain-containing protein [Methanobacterium spitsbergense]MBZ2166836.1 beta-lactamase family protein [Methanobacterium spitsbergense]